MDVGGVGRPGREDDGLGDEFVAGAADLRAGQQARPRRVEGHDASARRDGVADEAGQGVDRDLAPVGLVDPGRVGPVGRGAGVDDSLAEVEGGFHADVAAVGLQARAAGHGDRAGPGFHVQRAGAAGDDVGAGVEGD